MGGCASGYSHFDVSEGQRCDTYLRLTEMKLANWLNFGEATMKDGITRSDCGE